MASAAVGRSTEDVDGDRRHETDDGGRDAQEERPDAGVLRHGDEGAAVFIKARDSLLIAIVIAVSAALASASESLGFLFAFTLQAIFFWAICCTASRSPRGWWLPPPARTMTANDFRA
jgi:hypothetical protein